MLRPKSADALLIDNVEGVSDFLHHDESEGVFHRELLQDVEPILDDATRRRNDGEHGSSELRFAGRFPIVLVESWLHNRNLTIKDFKDQVVRDFLNDSDNSAFRVWPGRV